MGNKPFKLKKNNEIDCLLLESFKESDLEIPINQINRIQENIKQSKVIFNLDFQYFFFFNQKLFHDGLPTLYDNYIKKVEFFSSKNKKQKKIFPILIDFDYELKYLLFFYDKKKIGNILNLLN